MDEGYWTTNKAFILRGSICTWIQKELNARFDGKDTYIGFVNRDGEKYKAPVPKGVEIELNLVDDVTKKPVKFRTWDTVLSIDLINDPKNSSEELEKLAQSISLVEKLQDLKLHIICNFLLAPFLTRLN